MPTGTINISYCGIPLQVEYEIDPATGDGWSEPHYPETFFVVDAKSQTGDDVLDLFTLEAQDDISEIAKRKHYSGVEEAKVERRVDALSSRQIFGAVVPGMERIA